MTIPRFVVLAAVVCIAAVLPMTGTAAAGSAGRVTVSADAGYQVTGSHLSVAGTWVKLPEPWQFSREIGTIGASVQLWTAKRVIDLTVTACTDATCRPGGKPARRFYHTVLSVYNRATHALICSSAAAGSLQCAGTDGAFARQRLAPGHVISLSLVYTVPWLWVFAQAGNQDDNYRIVSSAPSKPTVDFTAARICVELAASPWSVPLLRAPRSAVKLMSFDRPRPPPYAAEIANLNGNAGGIAAAWWRDHVMSTSPRTPYATAGRLWDQGYGLTVYLER